MGNFPKSKKGQVMELPFQLIFSLILIAIFLYAAFTGIKYVLERGDQARIGEFLVDLKSKVNSAWQATEIENTYSFEIPKRIKLVCFGDLKKKINNTVCPDFDIYREQAVSQGSNLFFCPPKGAYSVGSPVHFKIDCNGNDCLEFKQPLYCVSNEGKISIRLEKSLGSKKVSLSV